MDATYDEYSFDQVDLSDDTDPPNFLTPVTGCDYTQLGVDGDPATPRKFVIDCSGRDALNAPEWTITAGVQQIWDLDGFELLGTLDARYRSEREVGFDYLPEGRVDSVVTADATLTLASNRSKWSLTAYVRNLSDEVVPTTYQLGAGNVTGSVLEPPRTYGAVLRVDF